MANHQDVADHYTHGKLVEAIEAAVAELGMSVDTVGVDDLAPVDEFHVGGRRATEDFLTQLSLSADTHVLDIGCGLGGAARFAADRFGCRVTGIDLTDEYVEAGKVLLGWVGLEDRVSLEQGSALDMPFDDDRFDAAYMLHVGMNIADKARLFTEVGRVVRPGAVFGIYDVMRTSDDALTYPVPWATTSATSAVSEPDHYKELLEAAGFEVTAERNRRDFALDFFDQMRARMEAAGGPPPLGTHILMGRNTPEKVQNMIANISAGRIAPVEVIARKS
ncbi:MAG: methyltransferase domain-containing protein [Alphaproteobacteria bacterium]|nr:methyltransferase domain-containing protein [Alphaproteobacteria bacterium]